MTDEQKEYIEQHINLIKEDKWTEFFKGAPKGIGGVLYEARLNFLAELSYIPTASFMDSNIQTIEIPDNITGIGRYAFYECKDLVNAIIGNCVTEISNFAFGCCSNLTNIVIPYSVTSIGKWAFYDCGNLNIKYDGTVERWKKLIGNEHRVFEDTTYTCDCIDGVVKKSW